MLQRKRRNRIWSLIILSIILCLFCGCDLFSPPKPSQPNIDISKILAKKRKKNKPKTKIISKKIFNKKFVYLPELITRDPFKPFLEKVIFKKQILPKNIPITPLTEYNLSQYKLVGIITDKKPPLAMVETADGKGLIFSIGDYIGTEFFKVVSIKDDKVILERKFFDKNKKIEIEKKILKIEISGE